MTIKNDGKMCKICRCRYLNSSLQSEVRDWLKGKVRFWYFAFTSSYIYHIFSNYLKVIWGKQNWKACLPLWKMTLIFRLISMHKIGLCSVDTMGCLEAVHWNNNTTMMTITVMMIKKITCNLNVTLYITSLVTFI